MQKPSTSERWKNFSQRPSKFNGMTGIQLDDINEQHENICVTVKVQHYPCKDIVAGRDSRVERREVMVLTVKTSTKKVLAVF